MAHIDEQISQIYNFLSPLHSSLTNNPSSPVSSSAEPPLHPRPPSLSLTSITAPSDINNTTLQISPVYEPSSFYTDTNQSAATVTDVPESPLQPPTNDLSLTPPLTRQSTDHELIALSIPPPPSVYNRSVTPSVISLGISSIPRGTASNKIVPAPSSTSPQQRSSTSFRPVSNTRYRPGHSPKPKARSHQNRSSIKHQQQSEKSTIIELESSTQKETTSKHVPLLSTSTSTTKSGSNVFRRFMTGGSNTEKTGMSSSTLLYLPTSDDEHPMSPASSGNDDDDYRPLTSSSNKHHHTLL
jgi:hypothetical protein